jgi:hypothetical protein
MGEIAGKRRPAVARGMGRAMAIGAAWVLAGCGSSGDAADAGSAAVGDGAAPIDAATSGLDAFAQADGSLPGDASSPPDAADAASADGPEWTPGPDGGCPSPGPPFGGGEPTVNGGLVSATVVNLTGAPLSGFPAEICGLDVCPSPRSTNSSGAVTIDARGFSMRKPVLGYGDAQHWPLLLVPVPAGPMIDLGRLVTAALPSSGAPLTPGGDAVSGDVTVSLAPGGTAIFNTAFYGTPDAQALRAVALPAAKESCMPGVAANSLALLYGVAPIDTLFCPAAKVTVANRAGWPAGARVGFYILGDDTAQPWAPYGDWALISDGVVSADGTAISTADGQGFPQLETFGVRLEP